MPHEHCIQLKIHGEPLIAIRQCLNESKNEHTMAQRFLSKHQTDKVMYER